LVDLDMANWVRNNSSFEAIPIIDIDPLVIPNDNSKSLQKTVNEIRDDVVEYA